MTGSPATISRTSSTFVSTRVWILQGESEDGGRGERFNGQMVVDELHHVGESCVVRSKEGGAVGRARKCSISQRQTQIKRNRTEGYREGSIPCRLRRVLGPVRQKCSATNTSEPMHVIGWSVGIRNRNI